MRDVRTKNAIGRYIVSDPKICHGQPTFRGTRVLVADVLDQVAAGMDWQSIIEDWHGNITEDAIREAVDLANRALIKHGEADTKRRGLRKSRRENLLPSSRAELGNQHSSEVTEELTEPESVQCELMKQFERSLSLMSSQERLAFTLIRVLELPSRVAAVVLTSAGFPCTHPTAVRWASDALSHYFPKVKRAITDPERKPRSTIRSRAIKLAGQKKAAQSEN